MHLEPISGSRIRLPEKVQVNVGIRDMRSKENKIRAADDKLLKREQYYRSARSVEIGIGIVILLGMLARLSRSPETMPQHLLVSYWILMMVFFASSWVSDAKIRHIDSIKVNRKETGEIPTPI